jgi:hypothetical protein
VTRVAQLTCAVTALGHNETSPLTAQGKTNVHSSCSDSQARVAGQLEGNGAALKTLKGHLELGQGSRGTCFTGKQIVCLGQAAC